MSSAEQARRWRRLHREKIEQERERTASPEYYWAMVSRGLRELGPVLLAREDFDNLRTLLNMLDEFEAIRRQYREPR